MGAPGLQATWQQTGGTGRNHDISTCMLADLFVNSNLELFALRYIFLNKIGITDSLGDVTSEMQLTFFPGHKTGIFQYWPGIRHHLLNVIP